MGILFEVHQTIQAISTAKLRFDFQSVRKRSSDGIRSDSRLHPDVHKCQMMDENIQSSFEWMEVKTLEKYWWISVLQWFIWAIAVTLILGWMSRGRNRRPSPNETLTLVYPTSILVLGIVCVVFFSGLEIVSIVFDNGTTSVLTHSVFLVGSGLGLYYILEFILVNHQVSDTGLDSRRSTGISQSIRWSDVTVVSHSNVLKWYKIKTSLGKTARISFWLIGQDEFANMVLKNVQPNVIDPQTKQILQSAAGGRLPDVW